MKEREDESLASAMIDYIQKQLKELREWLRPVSDDSIFLKIIKGIFKTFVLIILTVLSPVVLLILVIAFFAAF
jgi:hypothetical protein